MSRFRNLRRAAGQTAGAPSTLLSAEIFYNMTDGVWYGGFGDNGAGSATSARAFAKDDFRYNLPEGVNGKVLGFTGGIPVWIDPPEGGGFYTAGAGLSLTGSAFAVDFTVAASRTWATSTFAPLSHLHAAADITSGVFDVARIPALDASKITSGILDAARLPASVFQAPIVAATNIASLSAPQQAEVRVGSTVVTSDGRFWSYVTGSKTAEASYREMADTTPEWSVIANKPTFSTVASTGAYADLSGKPSLGTLSTQAANSVAITGGVISGVTITDVILDAGTA